MKKRSGLLCALLAAPLFFAGPRLCADQLSELSGVTVNNVKIPFHNRGTLQAMIFADQAEYRAKLLYGREVVLDMLQKNVDPDRIGNDWRLRLYPLRAPLTTVSKFWFPRLNYCDAVIYSPEGALDQLERCAAGDKLVQMRSPSLDLDGVGFAADFKHRQIKVNSDVKLVLRMPSADPRKFGEKLPEKYEFLEGKSEMLHLDTARNRVMLLGKVEIFDEKFKLTCDRLTVLLGSDKKNSDRSSMNFSGISAIYADGNVKMARRLPPGTPSSERREVRGDHMIYDTAKEQMTMTGDRTPPCVISGDGMKLRGRELVYFVAKRQLIVPKDCWMTSEEKGVRRYLRSDYGNFNFGAGYCDFLENVRGSAPQHELACDKMRVFLRRKEGAPAPQRKTDGTPISDAGNLDTGSMEFERALCRGRVKMVRTEGKGVSTLDSEQAEIDYVTDKAVFSGNVKARSDGNTLETETLVLNLRKKPENPRSRELESAETLAPVRIAGTTDPATQELSVITADRGFFAYRQDRIDFLGNVKAARGKSTLQSDKLELFLAPGGKDDRPVALPGVTAGSGKTLKSAVATGNAVMSDTNNNLQADRLDFAFVPAPPGAPQEPGIFQSGSLRLTEVTGNGNVVVSSRKAREPVVTPRDPEAKDQSPAPAPGSLLGGGGSMRELRSARMVSDMLKRRSVFSGHVIMTDEQNRLDCEELTFYAKPAAAAAAAAATGTQKPAAPVEDVDADPFELPVENKVPSSVVLGNGLELDRAVAKEKVVLRQKKDSEESNRKFLCDQAEFRSSDMTIVCTGTEEERPSVETGFKVHEADKFVLHLKDERLETIGDVITR